MNGDRFTKIYSLPMGKEGVADLLMSIPNERKFENEVKRTVN